MMLVIIIIFFLRGNASIFKNFIKVNGAEGER